MKKSLEERVASLVGGSAPRARKAASTAYVTDSQKLTRIFKKHWIHSKYDTGDGHGEARVGSLGLVTWHDSGSDPGVVVTIPQIRIKASAEDAAAAIEAIRKIVANTGV
jgi:hypothetical protein